MLHLHEGPDLAWPAKARYLADCAAMGVQVPGGVVLPLDTPRSSEHRRAITRLLQNGPVIARSALVGEDEADASAAGLGISVGGLVHLADVLRAIDDIAAQRHDPWLSAYRRSLPAGDHVIVQSHVPTRWLLAIAVPPGPHAFVEVHDPTHDALARGTTPRFAGRLEAWADPAREAVAALLEALHPWRDRFRHGLDLEVVVDPRGGAHLVQLRPLSRELTPGWAAFEAAVRAAGQGVELRGRLTLDAEHNPAPLSVAHAWLMRWLRDARPNAGDPTVLAGWLYARTLPRALQGTATSAPPSAREALAQLQDVFLPEARSRLAQLESGLAAASRRETARALDHALACFVAMIDTYLAVLVPARRHRTGLQVRPEAPFSTAGRAAFVDVLPTVWDIASPSLGDIEQLVDPLARAADAPTFDTLDEATAATLLAEWDDHLFALGLAPVRAVYRRAGVCLGLGDEVFLLDGEELRRALETGEVPGPPERTARAARQSAWAALRPPLHIEDGQPLPIRATQELRGIPIGMDFEGPVTHRRDLEDLLRNPPHDDAIVILPALSAQAALALAHLGIRAVCCEYGGAMSHAALMTRELSLSALIGCQGCTRVPEGTFARIDTRLGRLWCRTPERLRAP